MIRAAAAAAKCSVGAFVRDSAKAAAIDVLANRRQFALDAAAWTTFKRALEVRPRTTERLARLLNEPSVFDRGEHVGPPEETV